MIALASVLLLIGPPNDLKLSIDGVERRAVIYSPSIKSDRPPIVFAFHGHGGNARSANRTFGFEKAWPEAVVVYPEGLPTKTVNDPEGSRNGWDGARVESNKDLKFFDAMFEQLKKEQHFDEGRVFVMGHSNGGAFTYLLWQLRSKRITAVGPCAAAGAVRVNTPRPAFILKGETDPIVNPRLQQISIDAVLSLNKVDKEPKKLDKFVSAYAGANPVVTYIHPGGHQFIADAIPWMVKFFKSLPKGL